MPLIKYLLKNIPRIITAMYFFVFCQNSKLSDIKKYQFEIRILKKSLNDGLTSTLVCGYKVTQFLHDLTRSILGYFRDVSLCIDVAFFLYV